MEKFITVSSFPANSSSPDQPHPLDWLRKGRLTLKQQKEHTPLNHHLSLDRFCDPYQDDSCYQPHQSEPDESPLF